MASTQTNLDPQVPATTESEPRLAAAQAEGGESVLVSLPALPADALDATIANLSQALAGESVVVATPDAVPLTGASVSSSLRLMPYTPPTPLANSWVLTAGDFVNASRLAQEQHASVCLILGAEAQSLTTAAIRSLFTAISSGSDLALPRYDLGPRDGLVNSAILYPVSRALFGVRARFPLAIDLGLSSRMATRLAAAGQRFVGAGVNDALIWPIAEGASAGYIVTEVDGGTRTLPQPASTDFNALLAQITGSLFADVDAKASLWQRSRAVQPGRPPVDTDHTGDALPDVTPILEAFRIAYINLHEIWSLILPPNSLLGLKRLSQMPPASFRMPDALWARIVYDFILAFRLRTINRGHLLGALTPLYLAWVASHILLITAGTAPEKHIEQLAAIFESDKAYLVSRWRWPDRFNP